MIEISSIGLTYCHRCEKPARCGQVEISEWSHKLYICSNCLMEFARKIDMDEKNV